MYSSVSLFVNNRTLKLIQMKVMKLSSLDWTYSGTPLVVFWALPLVLVVSLEDAQHETVTSTTHFHQWGLLNIDHSHLSCIINEPNTSSISISQALFRPSTVNFCSTLLFEWQLMAQLLASSLTLALVSAATWLPGPPNHPNPSRTLCCLASSLLRVKYCSTLCWG